MLQAATVLFVLTLLTILPNPLLAQQPDELDRRDNERVRYEQRMGLEHDPYAQVTDIREAFIRNEMKEAQKTLANYRVDPAAADKNFVARIPEFHKAVADYRTAMKGDTGTVKTLKELNRFVEVFKTYFRTVGAGLPAVSTSEFKTLSREVLLQETLASAERIDTQLEDARAMVESANKSNTVTLQSVTFMRALHGEIHRLGAMISKLK